MNGFSRNTHIFILFFSWRYSAKLGQKMVVFTYWFGDKNLKPVVVFIETGGFCGVCGLRPTPQKTPGFNETTTRFQVLTPNNTWNHHFIVPVSLKPSRKKKCAVSLKTLFIITLYKNAPFSRFVKNFFYRKKTPTGCRQRVRTSHFWLSNMPCASKPRVLQRYLPNCEVNKGESDLLWILEVICKLNELEHIG